MLPSNSEKRKRNNNNKNVFGNKTKFPKLREHFSKVNQCPLCLSSTKLVTVCKGSSGQHNHAMCRKCIRSMVVGGKSNCPICKKPNVLAIPASVQSNANRRAMREVFEQIFDSAREFQDFLDSTTLQSRRLLAVRFQQRFGITLRQGENRIRHVEDLMAYIRLQSRLHNSP